MRVTTVDDRCRLFFYFFSTISNFSIFPNKVVAPDVSEKVLGRPRGSGCASWASGGGPGGLFGSPGGVRGTLWARLERHLGVQEVTSSGDFDPKVKIDSGNADFLKSMLSPRREHRK